MSDCPDLAALPALPRDDGGPVFREPWEARAFALTLRLHEAGLFTWSEWARTLSAEIAQAQATGDGDAGSAYYRHWLRALERITAEKGLVAPDALAERARAILAGTGADHGHDHAH